MGSVLTVFLSAALAPRMALELGSSPERVVGAGSTLFLWSALLSVPAGHLVDRIGWKTSIRLSLLCSGLVLLVAARTTSVEHLLFIVWLGGLANALALPGGNALLMAHVRPQRHGVAYGLRQSAIPLASVMAGAVLAMTHDEIWREAFTGLGVAMLALACLLPPPNLRYVPPERDHSAAPTSIGRAPVLIACAAGLGSAAATATATFLVASSIRTGLTQGEAGLLLATASGLGIGVRVLSGLYVDRCGSAGRTVAILMGIGALGSATLAVPISGLLFIGSMLALGAGWGWQGILQHFVATENKHRVGMASGVVQTGLAAGAAAGPMMFAALTAALSYSIAWLATAMAAAAGAVALHRIARNQPA